MIDANGLLVGAILRFLCTRRSLLLENLALRQQLAVFKRRHPHSTTELVSAFIQDPVAFAKKAEDLVVRVVSDEDRQLLQVSKTVAALVTGAEPPFEGSVGRAIQ